MRDTFYSVENAQVCKGEEYVFQGSVFEADTFFCTSWTNQFGCDSTLCLSLDVVATPSEWTIEGALCNDQAVSLAPSPGFFQYQWSTGSLQPVIEVDMAGWYFVTLTDGFGCVSFDSIFVGDNSFEVFPESRPLACPGVNDAYINVDSIIGGVPPFQFSLNGGPFGPSGQFSALLPGVYQVDIADVAGCNTALEFFLPEPPPFWVSLGPDQTVALGEPVEIAVTASDPLSLLVWLPPSPCDGCWELEYRPLVTETLVVQLASSSGCLATDAMRIEVLAPEVLVYFPNIFTPNADGANDYWTPGAGKAVGRFLSLRVFSRWGDLLYSDLAPGPELRWDGSGNGKPVPSGVYVCVVEYELINGERRLEAKEVTVMR